MTREQQIERAAGMLARIDRNVGERTVGARRAEAASCAAEVGLEVETVASEHVAPTVAEIIEKANSMR